MLQDVEAGKALETEAIIGAIVELGELTDTPTPAIRAIYLAVKLLNRTLTEEAVRIRAEHIVEDAPASVLIKPAVAAAGR
jgi:2-dehydropantoate 2-reductase